MNIHTTEISGSNIENSEPTEAFGAEISLLYFKKDEWENISKASKQVIKRLAHLLGVIQKNGPDGSNISDKNGALLKKNDIAKYPRFYKVIKEKTLEKHYKYRLGRTARVLLSFEKNNDKGYLICFDHDHSIRG